MCKLWRRTPKVDRIPAALAAHFRAKPGVSINMVALLQRGAVPVVPAHEYNQGATQ